MVNLAGDESKLKLVGRDINWSRPRSLLEQNPEKTDCLGLLEHHSPDSSEADRK